MRTIITSIFLLFVLMTQGQIKGVVRSADSGDVISGVIVKSKNNKAFTDENGRYAIAAAEGDNLTFECIGFKRKIVKVAKSKVIDVSLEEENNTLEEVVIMGYSAPIKKEVAHRSASVSNYSKVADASAANKMYVTGTAPNSNQEEYKQFQDNGFMNTRKDPLSTFAADVDVASYTNIKRFIQSGKMPPIDAVRVEEMINYFQYAQSQPVGDKPVSITTELAYTPWNNKHQLLRITLKGKDIPKEKLPPSNFVFLVDISGSMNSDNKLPLVKSSLKLLIDQLRDIDKVAIVTYAGQANVALESISANQKQKIKDIIDGLAAGGSTAGGDGLKMAYNIARQNFIKTGNNRIVMATDGDFNVGSSSDADMEKLVERERESKVNISVLGFGMGNYKDAKLETIANKGRGNYAYINDISEARKAMISEFGGTMFTIAKDVKIQVEFNPKYVQNYRLIGYENRLLAAEDFNNDAKIGGDMGVGHVVTALYEIVPVGVISNIVGSVDPLKYQAPGNDVLNTSTDLATVKFRYKEPNGDKSKLQEHIVLNKASRLDNTSMDFQFMTAVAELGMLLRNSEYKQYSNFDALVKRARANKGTDFEGYRAEFVRLAEDAAALYKSEQIVVVDK